MRIRDENIINLCLKDVREAHTGKDERTPIADDISLGVDKCYYEATRTMLKKNERIQYGELGEITIMDHRILFNSKRKTV